MIDQQTAIERYAKSLYDMELKYQRERRPERLAQVEREEPQRLAEYMTYCRNQGKQFVELIIDPERRDLLYKRFNSGLLHPDNKRSRRLFQDLTGVKLPPTVKGTRAAFAAWFGQDDFEERIASKLARQMAEDQARARARADAHKAEMDRIARAVLRDEYVTGRELVDLARHLGVEIHLRTQGVLIARVNWINSGSCRFHGNRPPSSVYDAHEMVQAALLAQQQEATQ